MGDVMIIHSTTSTMDITPWKINDKIRIDELYSVFLQKSDRSYNFPGEFHDFWEVMYIISGSVKVSSNQKIYDLSKGTFIFHRPLEFHRFSVTSDNTELLVFSFKFDGVLQANFHQKIFLSTPDIDVIMENFISYVRKNNKSEQVIPFTTEIFQNHLKPLESWVYRHMIQTYIYQIILLLHKENSFSPEHISPDSLIYRKAVEYMQERLFEQISVDEIASHVHVSISHLKRVFSKYTKMGVHQYFLKRKLILAVQLLQSGNTVAEVSEKLGFNTQSYFSTTFKRELGISPSSLKHNRI